ncbi:hypothetical protein M3Y97_00449500 [Aphelenchoides bicaudatus]|nr:hypothetical protein M3Y97_00449500 [Aphelenchoides bicaudatus]
MPQATSRANHSSSASTSRSSQRRASISESVGFEELALSTLQALHPNRHLQLSDIKMSRVRRLVKQLVNGQIPPKSCQQFSAKGFDLPSTSILLSPPPKKLSRLSRHLPKIEEEDTNNALLPRHSITSSLGRKISFGSSVDSQESEEATEKEPQSQLERLIDSVLLGNQTTPELFTALKQELAQLFKSERTTNAQNKKQLHFLETQLLRSEIDSRRQPQKNIQCIELHVLVELHKLRLLHDLHQLNEADLDKRSKAVSKLRFLNIITGGQHLAVFMREVMDSEFALSIPNQLKIVHERMCIDMPDNHLQFLSCPTTTDALFSNGHLTKSNNNLTVDTPSSLDSTPRNRSNSTPQSSSSAVSGFREDFDFPTLEKMASLDSLPLSPTTLKGNVIEDTKENSSRLNKQSRRRKTSSSSTNETTPKLSSRRTTLDTDNDPPPLLSPAAIIHENEDVFELPTLPKLSARRSSRATTTMNRKTSIKEEEPSETTSRRTSTASRTSGVKAPLKVDARGSIASRRQSNKRLCVIRQNPNSLIMATSRRSSTASLLQKQQEQKQQTTRRSSYFERLALEVQKQALRNVEAHAAPAVKDKKKPASGEMAPPPVKKAKITPTIITESIVSRYRKRMNDLYQHSKQLDEHEVFYGRCNGRVDLFESEKTDNNEEQKPVKPAPSKSTQTKKTKQKAKSDQMARKQKNRSGHLVKQDDCLYIAHTLLNVHNRDPLSSNKPKAGNGTLIWGSCGRRAAALANGQSFRIRRLVKHANRAKVIKLRQYMQRSQQQQLLKRIKQEKKDEEERLSAPIVSLKPLSC